MDVGVAIITVLGKTLPRADRLARLNTFLREGAGLPFVWGQRDCSLWPCEWIKAERGIDPAEHLRGTYDTALACARIQRDAGGLPALAAHLAARAGLLTTDAPEAGDVGLVEFLDAPLMALCTGPKWAIKTKDGLVIVPATPVQTWIV
ncbi:DUF6950 family protein [Methylorubrum extorquens]|uniref:DUF6950 family protein n=1 Tax=Methylorubrum extorquens TaxID=408 RepID=UPI003F5D56C5